MRVFEDPEIFDIAVKGYMELWGVPENNAKDFAEHARTQLPPKVLRILAERKKKESKPTEAPEWIKEELCGSLPPPEASSPTSPTAAGSGLGAVRALQQEKEEPNPLDEARARMLAEDKARIEKMRAEMMAKKESKEEPQDRGAAMDPKDQADLCMELCDKKEMTQTEKWAAMGMF